MTQTGQQNFLFKNFLQLGSIFVIVLCLTPFLIYKENQIDNLFLLFLHFHLATIKRTGLYVHLPDILYRALSGHGFVVSTIVCGVMSIEIKFSRNRAQIKYEEQTSYRTKYSPISFSRI
jgi:hypothetical protein